jgi:hypothetical protein
MGKTFLSLVVVVVAAAGSSCADPVHDLQVKALGDDPQGIPDGEFHRAGQPCLTCHGFYGPASHRYAVAGTIFSGPDKGIGADLVAVELVDSDGTTRNVVTNCVGNFFVRAEDWDTAFPIGVWLRRGTDIQHMQTQISREGSCSECHKDAPQQGASFDRAGHVHLYNQEQNTPPPPCAFSSVSPVANVK